MRWQGEAYNARASLGIGFSCKQSARSTGSIWGNKSFGVVVLDGAAQNPLPYVKYSRV